MISFIFRRLCYVKRNTRLYKSPNKKKGIVANIQKGCAVIITEKIKEGEDNWCRVELMGESGWIERGMLRRTKPLLLNKYRVEYLNKRAVSRWSLKRKASVHNSIVVLNTFIDRHRKRLESNGVVLSSFVRRHPVVFKIQSFSELEGAGGKYYPKNKKKKFGEIVVGSDPDTGRVIERVLVHEYGHHIGFSVAHRNFNFKGFSKHKNIEEVNDNKRYGDWANQDVEKYADTHTEAYLANFVNRTSVGNFETEQQKKDFISWEVKRMNRVFFLDWF